MPTSYTKDPSDVLDYRVDWTSFLGSGETISSVTWTVPVGITKDSQTNTTTTATVWLSGGTAPTGYAIACRITTNQARTVERSFTVRVENR